MNSEDGAQIGGKTGKEIAGSLTESETTQNGEAPTTLPTTPPEKAAPGQSQVTVTLAPTRPQAAALQPKGAPHHPLTVTLLNLNGLGLGYLYLRRWRRWAFHLIITVALVATAYSTNAARYPLVWGIVFSLWLAWMVFDGWWQGWRLRQTAPAESVKLEWMPLGIAALLAVGAAASLGGYLALGYWEFTAAMSAYRQGNYRAALPRFNRLTSVYELTLSPNVGTADGKIVECGLLIYAENAQKSGDYLTAIAGYETYLDRYSNKEASGRAKELAAEAYADLASQLRAVKRFESAIERYRTLLNHYPETPTAQQVLTLVAETYDEWAADLRAKGQFDQAIYRYSLMLDGAGGTPLAAQANMFAAQTYDEWADQLREAGSYETAIQKWQIILDQYDNTASAIEARNVIAETYAEWADELGRAGNYDAAVEKYQILSKEYADTPSAKEAGAQAVKAYLEWADELRKTGKFGAAIDRYRIISLQFDSASATVPIRELMAQTYYDWGASLQSGGNYTQAIEKYNIVVNAFADTKLPAIAEPAIGQAYHDWGKSLIAKEEFIEAMEKFTFSKAVTSDPEAISAAEKGYNDALWKLSQSATGEGKQVVDQTNASVCQGKPAVSPAVGLGKDEAGRALFCGSASESKLFTLPSSLTAIKPAHFRYVLNTSSGVNTVETCNYMRGHTLIRQRQWWTVKVYSTITGKPVSQQTFYGSQPGSCPFSRYFLNWTEYETGGAPSSTEVIEWLRSVMR